MTVYSKIIGTGSYLPPTARDQRGPGGRELAAKGIETSDEWIVSRSGISARHYAAPDDAVERPGGRTRRARAGWPACDPNEIDLIIVATSTPDFYGSFPSTACIVQRQARHHQRQRRVRRAGRVQRLRLRDVDGRRFIKSGAHKNVLVIGAEVFSRILNFEDRTTCVLFGDGAGAVVLIGCRTSPASWPPSCMPTAAMPTSSASQATCHWRRDRRQRFLYMDGPAVFKLAVSVLEKVANEALDAAGHAGVQIDWLIPHQANIRIMQGTAKKLGLAAGKNGRHRRSSMAIRRPLRFRWRSTRQCATAASSRATRADGRRGRRLHLGRRAWLRMCSTRLNQI